MLKMPALAKSHGVTESELLSLAMSLLLPLHFRGKPLRLRNGRKWKLVLILETLSEQHTVSLFSWLAKSFIQFSIGCHLIAQVFPHICLIVFWIKFALWKNSDLLDPSHNSWSLYGIAKSISLQGYCTLLNQNKYCMR